MHIIIIGARQVGLSVAANLDGAHEVVVIDCDPKRVDGLGYSLGVLALHGDGTLVGTLEKADVKRAGMVIASTDDDEIDTVACATTKAIPNMFTIARVKSMEYLRMWQCPEKAFGINFMVCTNLLAAEFIARVVGLPAAHDADPSAGGQVQMAEPEVDEESSVANQTVGEADHFDSLTFAAVLRDGEVIIPCGGSVVGPGDRVVVIGSPKSVQGSASSISPDEPPGTAEEVVTVGGSETSYHVACLLEEHGLRPRLIEHDMERARELAEILSGTIVIEDDAADVDFFEREYIDDADLLVSALDSDEENLLVSPLAARLGAKRTVAAIGTTSYVNLFGAVGVDVDVSPRGIVAEEITCFAREGDAENVVLIESDKAEVLEIEVDAENALAGKPIRKSVMTLPKGVVISAVTRHREFITPRGDTVIESGDHVVVLVDSYVIDDVTPNL